MSSDRPIAYFAAGPVPPSKPPTPETGVLHWLRLNLFDGVVNTVVTLISIAALVVLVPPLVDWAVLNAVWNAGSLDDCRAIILAAHGEGAQGACWAVFNGRVGQLLFGPRYPPELYWRPGLTLGLLPVALAPVLFGGLPRRMLWFSAVYPVIAIVLIWGVSEQTNEALVRELAVGAGLDISTEEGLNAAWSAFWTTRFTHLGAVTTYQLGGFLSMLALSLAGAAAALPIGVALAVGRQSSLFTVRVVCATAIEFIRGVPLLVLIFAGAFVWIYFLPPGAFSYFFFRISVVVALPSAVQMAEAIRGNLAAVPRGQYEAAAALGLGYGITLRRIILPQAFRRSIPQLVSACVGLVRNTALFALMGALDPIGFMNPIRASAQWNGILWEPYVVAALLYWILCFAISRYAAYLDGKLCADPRWRTAGK